MNRNSYDDFEDVRMLKWLARKKEATAPLGIALWKEYVQEYKGHTPQSLNGRMRRQILPNLTNYVSFLKISDILSLYMMFKERLDPESRKEIKRHIIRIQAMKKEDPEKKPNGDDDEADLRASFHKDRRKTIGTFHQRIEPPDDIDEDVPPLSMYRRKTIGGADSREASGGPSTSAAGPSSPIKRSQASDEVRRRDLELEEVEEDIRATPMTRKVIGEVSSTAILQSDDDEEELRRSLKQKKKSSGMKSPESVADVTIHNVVGVVSSTASILQNHQDEPTSSGRPVIQSPDSFIPIKQNTSIVSDDDIFAKASPKKPSNSHMVDPEDLEDEEDVYLNAKPSQKQKKIRRRQDSDIQQPIPLMKADLSRRHYSDDEEVFFPSPRPKKKKNNVVRRPQVSDDDDDVFPTRSPQKLQPSPKKNDVRRRQDSEEEEEEEVPEFRPKKKKRVIPVSEDEDDEEVVAVSPKKKSDVVVVVPKGDSPKKKKKKRAEVPTSPKKPSASAAPLPARPEDEIEDDSDYVSPKSTPRKQKTSVNSEDEVLAAKKTSQQTAELSEPEDDDDYVSRPGSPLPLTKPYSDEEEEEEVVKSVTTLAKKREEVTPPPMAQKQVFSPPRSPSKKPTTSTAIKDAWEEKDEEDAEVEKIMSNSIKSPQQKAPKIYFRTEAQKVEIAPQKVAEVEVPKVQVASSKPEKTAKKVSNTRRRSSDEKDDEEEESEVVKAMRSFEGTPSKKSKTSKKTLQKTSAQKSPQKTPAPSEPAAPLDDEDDDLADRILATIRERKSRLGQVEAEETVVVEPEVVAEVVKQNGVEEVPEKKKKSKDSRKSGGSERGKRSGVDEDARLMSVEPVAPEATPDDVPTAEVTPSRRRRPSYSGMPPPKDDRRNFHWKKDTSGRNRWQKKPIWLLELEAEDRAEAKAQEARRQEAERLLREAATTEDEEAMSVQGSPKKKRGATSHKRRTCWVNYGKTKKPKTPKSVDTKDDGEERATMEVMTEDEEAEEPERGRAPEEVDTEEEEEAEADGQSSSNKRDRREVLDGEEEAEGLNYFYTVDKLGRKRKWPRKRKDPIRSPAPQRAKIVSMIQAGILHTTSKEERERLMAEEVETVVKRKRGRPPKKKIVEHSPEYHDPMLGTSSSRAPPFEMQTSMASTTMSRKEEQDRMFSFQQWNLDMRPVAEQAARAMYTEMFQHLEGRLVPEAELRDIVLGDNVQQLFDKMFKEDEQQGEEDFVIVGVESFSAKKLRLRYFVKIQEELRKYTATPHVRSAVLTFFQYFEYTVAATVTGKNFDTYILLMDRLITVAIPLATF